MDLTLPGVSPLGSLDRNGIAAELAAISKAAGLAPSGADGLAGTPAAQGVADSFGAFLAQAVEDINRLHQAADADANRLAAGEPVDLHQVLINMERANLSFDLALQVRNKALDAYQEISHMTI